MASILVMVMMVAPSVEVPDFFQLMHVTFVVGESHDDLFEPLAPAGIGVGVRELSKANRGVGLTFDVTDYPLVAVAKERIVRESRLFQLGDQFGPDFVVSTLILVKGSRLNFERKAQSLQIAS